MTPLIEPQVLNRMLGEGDLVVVDCRFDLSDPEAGRRRYARAHLPGARYADLDTDLSAPRGPGDGRHPLPAPERLAETLRGLGVSRSSRVVAYDDAGGAVAARLWWLMCWLGHGEVAVLDGGVDAWTAAGFALDTAVPAAQRGDFEPSGPDSAAVVASDGLERELARGALLLDARSPERFAGTAEPIDPVAGHVPGAVNLPFAQLLTPEGRFEPRAALRARFDAVLAGRDARDVIAMCGSGVTACHLLLGLAHAGFDGGRLYAGSWSAWITDPGRPVARANRTRA